MRGQYPVSGILKQLAQDSSSFLNIPWLSPMERKVDIGRRTRDTGWKPFHRCDLTLARLRLKRLDQV